MVIKKKSERSWCASDITVTLSLLEAKRSQSISNCVHLSEALPATKSVPLLLHTVSALLPGLSYSSCSHRLSGTVMLSLVHQCQCPWASPACLWALLPLSIPSPHPNHACMPGHCSLRLFSMNINNCFYVVRCLVAIRQPRKTSSHHWSLLSQLQRI